MFKNGIDLKMLGIWNLAIAVLVLPAHLITIPAEVYAESL
jgi:hypothetical protein